jgi:hypothetical protein
MIGVEQLQTSPSTDAFHVDVGAYLRCKSGHPQIIVSASEDRRNTTLLEGF